MLKNANKAILMQPFSINLQDISQNCKIKYLCNISVILCALGPVDICMITYTKNIIQWFNLIYLIFLLFLMKFKLKLYLDSRIKIWIKK